MTLQKQRTHSVGFDPSVLSNQFPRIESDPDDTSDEREELRWLICLVFASGNEDAFKLLMAIVDFDADGRVIRRDGTNRRLSQLLGVSEGQASRRFRGLVVQFDLMAGDLKQHAANLGKARPDLIEREIQTAIFRDLWEVAEWFRTGRETAALGGTLALYRIVCVFREALLCSLSNHFKSRNSA